MKFYLLSNYFIETEFQITRDGSLLGFVLLLFVPPDVSSKALWTATTKVLKRKAPRIFNVGILRVSQ